MDLLIAVDEEQSEALRKDASEVAHELMTILLQKALFEPDTQSPSDKPSEATTRPFTREDVATSVARCFADKYRYHYFPALSQKEFGTKGITREESGSIFSGFVERPPLVPTDRYWPDIPDVKLTQSRIILSTQCVAVCWWRGSNQYEESCIYTDREFGQHESVAAKMQTKILPGTGEAGSSKKTK